MAGYIKFSSFSELIGTLKDAFIVGYRGNKNVRIKAEKLLDYIGSVSTGGGTPTYFEGDTLPSEDNHGAEAERGNWVILKNGTYNNIGGGSQIEIPQNTFGVSIFDGTSYGQPLLFELPEIEGVSVINPEGTEIPNETAVATYVEPLFSIGKKGKNLVDTTKFVAGTFNINGGYGTTLNSIRLNYELVPQNLKGNKVTISGMGSVPTGSYLVVIKDAEDNLIFSLNGGGSADRNPKTIEVPENAHKWGFMIANDSSDGGIGTRPQDNTFVTSFMVNEGEVAMPFEPYNMLLVDPEKIYNPNSIKYSNAITENGEGAVPSKDIFKIKNRVDNMLDVSKNIINMKDSYLIKSGSWNSSGTVSSSLNWIRTERMDLPSDILSKLANNEDVYMWFIGGGSIPSGGAYVVFWDADGTPYPYLGEGSGTFPKRVKLEPNYVSYATTIANQATDGGVGTRPLNNSFTNTYMVVFGESMPEYEPYGEVIKKELLPVSSSSFDLREIIIAKQSDVLIYIYFHIGGASNRWFRINLRHQISESKFIDVWRIEGGWTVLRNGDSFSDLFQVVNAGVYENAIYTVGYTDALGSAHGWEMLENFNLFADGKKIDVSELNILKCKYLTFTTRTRFLDVTGASTVAYSNKKWEFKEGIFKIHNSINWLTNLTTSSNSYVSMLSIFRKNNQGKQITHTGMSNEDLTPQDITVSGFTTGIYTDKSNAQRRTLIAWGDDIKAEMTMVKRRVITPDGTIIENSPNAGMYIQNTPSPDYNKFYGRMGNIEIVPNSWWDIETEYKISNI